MAIYTLKKEQFLKLTKEQAWDFFGSPYNLTKITPPSMHFKILSDVKNKDMYNGMHIDYIIKPFLNIPMRWKTEISNVIPFKKFTDTQLKGPYKLWKHTHIFEEKNGGILMTDELEYALPFGILGTLTHALFIKKKVNEIFNYREQVLQTLF
jgi:ligand-binding SRPBCC domain-containing protein